jgi:hypothetical protein
VICLCVLIFFLYQVFRLCISFVFDRALSGGFKTLGSYSYCFAVEIPISISIMSILQFYILVLGIIVTIVLLLQLLSYLCLPPFYLHLLALLGAEGQDRLDLATRIEQQRARIRALELAAEGRRRADKNGLVRSRQQEEQRRGDRLVREEAATQALLRHKAIVAQDAEDRLQQKRAIFHQQEEQRRKDRQARDESAMRAHLRHEAAARARKAEEHRLAEESKLAMIRKEDQLAEERRLLRIKERGQKELLSLEQPDKRRTEREARDQASLYVYEQSEAAKRERELKRLLACQEDDRRRKDREARDRACLEALARHEAAAKIRKAQEVEDRRMTKLREAEHKRVLRDQQKELRRAEKQAEERERESAIQARKAEGALLRERVERQRSERSLGVAQRQAV